MPLTRHANQTVKPVQYRPQQLYAIYSLTAEGSWVYLFSWTRSPDAGMARAQDDARRFGKHFVAYEARPLPRGEG